MENMENNETTVLDKCENLLKDRFANYLIVGIDGEEIHYVTSGKVSGYGMALYMAREIEKEWDEEEEKED